MAECPVCSKTPREDDPGFTVELPHFGMTTACRTCAGGEDPIYAVCGRLGVKKIPKVGDRLALVCGWCRRANRQDDPGTPVRLYPEEVSFGMQHGVLMVCQECLPEILPTVRYRLGLPANASVGGNSLL